MNEKDELAECLDTPEVKKAGKELVDAVSAHLPSKACFGMTPVEAFLLCAEAINRMKERGEIATEKIEEFGKVVTKMKVAENIAEAAEKPLTNRRAAVEHTKRKIADDKS